MKWSAIQWSASPGHEDPLLTTTEPPRREQPPLLLQILRYNSSIHAVGFATFYALYALLEHVFPKREAGPFNWISAAVLLVITSGVIVVAPTLVPIKHTCPSETPVRDWSRLYLLLVTKGTNVDTVHRTISEMRHLHQLDSRIRLVVLTEQGRCFDSQELGVDVLFIPKDWQAPHAMYKARALEYFRLHQPLQADDWVLHLDEETVVDEHCVRTCIDFIERSMYEWGQGMILYNTVNYWDNALLTFAEILRFRDDLGRFQFQHGRLHKTFFGCHGSFLLSSGRIENATSWDTACLAEDFWWADRAWRLGSGGGFIPALAREQSNYTFKDFLNQRKRWFRGMCQVPGAFGKLMVVSWILSIFELPLGISYILGVLRLPTWLSVVLQVYFSSSAFSVAFSTLCSDLDAGLPLWRILWHLMITPVLLFGVQILQTSTVIYSVFTPARGFHIVVKG